MSTRATEAESVLKEHMGYLPVSEMERRGVSRTEISQLCPMSCANVVGPSSGAVSVR